MRSVNLTLTLSEVYIAVSPVFQFFIWSCSDAVWQFMGVTTTFYSWNHTHIFPGRNRISV